MDKRYSEADKRLARALIAVDIGEASAALADGAEAHKEPFRGISWSLIPLYYKAAKDGLGADFAEAKQMMRYLIQEKSPIKGLAHFIGAGYPFSREDIDYLLDNWLWRDSGELKMVVTRFLHNDDIMKQLIGTGQIEASLPAGDGRSLFEQICLTGLHRSAFEFAGLGADINQTVTVDGDSMPIIEAAALKGHVAVVNALIRSGAFYDADQLIAKSRRHSPQCEVVVTKSVSAFEIGVDMSDEDLLTLMPSPGKVPGRL